MYLQAVRYWLMPQLLFFQTRLLLSSLCRQSGPPGLGLQAPPSTSSGVFYFIFEAKSNYAALAGLELTM